jgi:uncharacterized membrane protein YjfL (UPF0719 family)
MQYFTLIGGFLGFILTLGVSILTEKDLVTSVFNATVGCVITGLLFCGFRFIAERCAKQVVAERTRIRDEEIAAEQAAQASQDNSDHEKSAPV